MGEHEAFFPVAGSPSIDPQRQASIAPIIPDEAVQLLLPTDTRKIDPHPRCANFPLILRFGVGRQGSVVWCVISSTAVDRLTLIDD